MKSKNIYVGYAAGLMLLFSGINCNSVFYQPDKEIWFPPERLGLSYEDIFIQSADGTRLHAWLFKSEGTPKGTILQFHGNAQNLTSHYTSLVWLTKHRYNLLIFDYRGYGKSESYPDREQINADAYAACRFVLSMPETQRGAKLILYGQSLGGIILAGMLTHNPEIIKPDAVILEGTFDSYQNIARRKLSDIWFTWPFQWLAYILVSDSYSPSNKYNQIHTNNMLIIHGEKDVVIPDDFGKRIASQTKNKAEFWLFPDVGHINTWFVENGKYKTKLLDYLNKI